VVADLPGLIEGASQGAGLGIRFLRHVERTRLLVHLIDTSDATDEDPVKAFQIINAELAAFSAGLMEKPMIVVASKLDATTDRSRLEELQKFCKKKGLEFHAISAATGEGVKELMKGMADALDKIPREDVEEASEEDEEASLENIDAIEAEAADDPDEDDGDSSKVKNS
jgi:GTP-binding protein